MSLRVLTILLLTSFANAIGAPREVRNQGGELNTHTVNGEAKVSTISKASAAPGTASPSNIATGPCLPGYAAVAASDSAIRLADTAGSAGGRIIPKDGEPPGFVAKLLTRFERYFGKRAVYKPLFSKDKDYLAKEAQFAEGPSPQRNMKLVPGSQQFRVSSEVKEIFEMRKQLVARYPRKVLGVLRGESDFVAKAAREQFAMIFEEFPKTHPDFYRREGDELVNLLTGDRMSLARFDKLRARDRLIALGNFVPDDLLFMKKVGKEWRLVGGNLTFPTNWDIEDFNGLTIAQIHKYLPGSKKSVKDFSEMINGVLDRTLTQVDVVCRNNWFLEPDPRYPLPGYMARPYGGPERLTQQNYKDNVFVRTERQTLRGMPDSGSVVFTIRPFVYPLSVAMEDKSVARKILDGIRVKLLPLAQKGDNAPQIARLMAKDLGLTPPFDTTVASLTREVGETLLLAVEKPPGVQLAPGEAVRLTLDTPTGRQSRIVSLASAPEGARLEFAVRDSDSAFKAAFKGLKPGTKVEIELLRSSLEFQSDKPAVMIAGGIGITPFRSFIQHAKDKKIETPMWLFYGNRDEIPFKKELDAAAASPPPPLGVEHVLSRPGPEWEGAKGRIDDAFLQRVAPTLPDDAIYYVVGSPQMTEDVRRALLAKGIPESRIKTEVFVGYEAGSKSNPPIDPKLAKECDTVCFCNKVNAGKIRGAIREGAGTLDAVKGATRASTSCGGCAANILEFLKCVSVEPIR